MKYKLVKLPEFSGKAASVYSIYIEKLKYTLFDVFLQEYKILLLNEINDIISRIRVIGQKTGAREQFFKMNEGKPGDGLCCLYDKPNKKLRLYTIRYGTLIVILGGGGIKPKYIKALQEDKKLKNANYLLREISKDITKRMKEGEIGFTKDGLNFTGNLEFNTDENY